MLLNQAKIHQPNALSWFQVAVAQEKLGDIDGCKESFRQVVNLDPDDATAAFNLGGICWNHGPKSEAIQIWTEAIMQFPTHPLAMELRQKLPHFFGDC
ncbi:hypothetical protein [Lacipirellula sp.]|uniref:hypothetical protein n=1 Tax=Lacipirellula sp. TaxID=2691419 RepID=UPI003D14F9BF